MGFRCSTRGMVRLPLRWLRGEEFSIDSGPLTGAEFYRSAAGAGRGRRRHRPSAHGEGVGGHCWIRAGPVVSVKAGESPDDHGTDTTRPDRTGRAYSFTYWSVMERQRDEAGMLKGSERRLVRELRGRAWAAAREHASLTLFLRAGVIVVGALMPAGALPAQDAGDSPDLARRGFVGVVVAAADPGLEVERVFEGSTASRIGLEVGDRIISLDDMDVSGVSDFVARVGAKVAGDPMAVMVRRGDREIELRDRVQEYPKEVLPGSEGRVRRRGRSLR